MIRPPHVHRLGLVLLTGAVFALAGCASSSGGLSGDPADYGSPTAEMTVTRFLDAARQEDFQGMSRQFGTRQGPAEGEMGISQVEQRMIVLGGLLGHDGFELERRDLARIGSNRARFVATMRGTRNGTVEVPVIAVQAVDGRWYVERLVMDSLSRQS